jgi:hypothetical protein
VFRGLTWSKTSEGAKDISEYKLGQVLQLSLRNPTSWTINPRIAFTYATEPVFSDGNDYGIILQMTIHKSQVLANLTKRDMTKYVQDKHLEKDLQRIYEINRNIKEWDNNRVLYEYPPMLTNQGEYVLLPGEYTAKIIFLRKDKVKHYNWKSNDTTVMYAQKTTTHPCTP